MNRASDHETASPKGLKSSLQHVLNPLHVFCRLKEAGFSDQAARRMCKAYERRIYRPLMA
jgi:hypothetical protein